MILAEEDKNLLKNLCNEHYISFEKVLRLLDTVKEHELKDRRIGIYESIKEIIKSDLKTI